MSEITIENPNAEKEDKPKEKKKKMKSFKQFSEVSIQIDLLNKTLSETHAYFNVEDPVAMQKLNAYEISIADKEYLQPDSAMHQLADEIRCCRD